MIKKGVGAIRDDYLTVLARIYQDNQKIFISELDLTFEDILSYEEKIVGWRFYNDLNLEGREENVLGKKRPHLAFCGLEEAFEEHPKEDMKEQCILYLWDSILEYLPKITCLDDFIIYFNGFFTCQDVSDISAKVLHAPRKRMNSIHDISLEFRKILLLEDHSRIQSLLSEATGHDSRHDIEIRTISQCNVATHRGLIKYNPRKVTLEHLLRFFDFISFSQFTAREIEFILQESRNLVTREEYQGITEKVKEKLKDEKEVNLGVLVRTNLKTLSTKEILLLRKKLKKNKNLKEYFVDLFLLYMVYDWKSFNFKKEKKNLLKQYKKKVKKVKE